MSKPNGVIYLLSNIPLDSTYEHTIKFKNKDEQLNYFLSKVKKQYQYTSYIKKKENLLVAYSYDDIEDVNYVLYRSSNNSRWYYSFVTSKKYKSDSMTEITIELDVMQTYQFDYNLLPSFVERCHVNRWEADKSPIFSYTEEDLDYGDEYVTERTYNVKRQDNICWFLVLMTHSQEFHEGVAVPSALNGNPTPYVAYLVPHYIGTEGYTNYRIGSDSTGYQKIDGMSKLMAFMGDSAVGGAIKEISFIPYLPFNLNHNIEQSSGTVAYIDINSSDLNFNIDNLKASESWISSTISTIFGDGETAQIQLLRINPSGTKYQNIVTLTEFNRDKGLDVLNNTQWTDILANSKTSKFDYRIESKLLTNPYRYNLLTTWKAQPVIIKNEYLPKEVMIKMAKTLSFNNPSRYWIADYKDDDYGRANSVLENTSLELPVISDSYYQYQLENKAQLNTGIFTNTLGDVAKGAVGGAMMGGAYGAVGGAIGGYISGAVDIASQLAKEADIKHLPDSVINTTDGSLAIADKNIYLSFYRYRINDTSMKKIANYWHMFGYKVTDVIDLAEAINSRERFNYVKTTACNITGSFDNEDLLKIKINFNKGITFWHYYEGFKILDYTYNNIEKDLL